METLWCYTTGLIRAALLPFFRSARRGVDPVLDGFTQSSQHRVVELMVVVRPVLSAGVFQPSVLRGLLLRVCAIAAR